MSQLEVGELIQHLPGVMAALAEGEEVILTNANVPFAKLIQIAGELPGRIPGSATGLFTMADDFDEPLDTLFEVFEEHD